MNNKENKKVTFTFNIALVITLVLAALKLDNILSVGWVIVILPIVINISLGLIIIILVMLWMLFLKIRDSIKEMKYSKLVCNNRTYGSAIHWDYKTQSFYDTAGNKIENTVENKEEHDY